MGGKSSDLILFELKLMDNQILIYRYLSQGTTALQEFVAFPGPFQNIFMPLDPNQVQPWEFIFKVVESVQTQAEFFEVSII